MDLAPFLFFFLTLLRMKTPKVCIFTHTMIQYSTPSPEKQENPTEMSMLDREMLELFQKYQSKD